MPSIPLAVTTIAAGSFAQTQQRGRKPKTTPPGAVMFQEEMPFRIKPFNPSPKTTNTAKQALTAHQRSKTSLVEWRAHGKMTVNGQSTDYGSMLANQQMTEIEKEIAEVIANMKSPAGKRQLETPRTIDIYLYKSSVGFADNPQIEKIDGNPGNGVVGYTVKLDETPNDSNLMALAVPTKKTIKLMVLLPMATQFFNPEDLIPNFGEYVHFIIDSMPTITWSGSVIDYPEFLGAKVTGRRTATITVSNITGYTIGK